MNKTRMVEGGQHLLTLFSGMALGALAMYLADPNQGRRRRAYAQDKMRTVSNRTGSVLNDAMRDAGSRLSGLQTQASLMMGQRAKPIDDHVLEARVRSRLGRALSYDHPVRVGVSMGRVTLSGPVRDHERQNLLEMVRAIPGVEDVRDRMEAWVEEEQGGGWSRLRLLAALGGGVMGYYGLSHRGASGMTLAAAGLGVVAGALGGPEIREWIASAEPGLPVEVEKSIEIQAAPETVFDLWSRFENYPQFLPHVIEVRDLGERRWHWVMRGFGGRQLEWDAQLTELSRPHALRWHTEPGASVEHTGLLRLEPSARGTRATVRLRYLPPAGVVAGGLATLFGDRVGDVLDDDLLRLKDAVEGGMPAPEAGGHDVLPNQGHILH